ncbi:hypothetical protein FHY19_003930 [Xanthomonas arboricola]|nr:hypothetical protein [Xanthomonas sp. 4461]
MIPIVCRGEDGIERIFNVMVSDGDEILVFSVRHEEYPRLPAYELSIEITAAGPVVWVMNRHGVEIYCRTGVPEATLVYASHFLGCAVSSRQSTPSRENPYANYRLSNASKVWERMVKSGAAIYDPSTDRFMTA